MQEHFYGINGQVIPREIIHHSEEILQDGDVIQNKDGLQLKYSKEWKGFFLDTEDFSKFVSNDQIYQQWKKI